jgi:hypothetical protein
MRTIMDKLNEANAQYYVYNPAEHLKVNEVTMLFRGRITFRKYRCLRRNAPDFWRVFLMVKYTDITQNTYVPS